MIGIDHDLYAEGAAITAGASTAVGNHVSESARKRFKKAFFETLWVYLYRSSQGNRDWVTSRIATVSRCVTEGKTLEETRDTLAAEAQEP